MTADTDLRSLAPEATRKSNNYSTSINALLTGPTGITETRRTERLGTHQTREARDLGAR